MFFDICLKIRFYFMVDVTFRHGYYSVVHSFLLLVS